MKDETLPLDTVLHGDSLDVLATLPDNVVNCIITDPPYGMDYQSARRIDKTQRKAKIANDKQPFIWWLYHAYRITQVGGALLCFCEWRHQDIFRMAIQVAGYTTRSQVIWDRQWHGLGDLNASFAPQHDVIWFATKGKFSFPHGRPKSVIHAQRLAANTLVHPNEKPFDLMCQLVRSVTSDNGIVLDPFAGSGSTGVACVHEGAHYILVEKEQEYVDIARARIAHAHTQVKTQDTTLWHVPCEDESEVA